MERTEGPDDAVASLGVLLRRMLVDLDIAVFLGVGRALLVDFSLSLFVSLHDAGESLHFVD